VKDISDTVEVMTESIYEAIALGLRDMRSKDWVEGLRDQFRVDDSVTEIPVRPCGRLKNSTRGKLRGRAVCY
jgi:hypothetical protein